MQASYIIIQSQNCAFLEQLVVSKVKINAVLGEEKVQLPMVFPCPAQGQEDYELQRWHLQSSVHIFPFSLCLNLSSFVQLQDEQNSSAPVLAICWQHLPGRAEVCAGCFRIADNNEQPPHLVSRSVAMLLKETVEHYLQPSTQLDLYFTYFFARD